jgi:anti-sigma regulatory factor (Ser/Thr protein kinase)
MRIETRRLPARLESLPALLDFMAGFARECGCLPAAVSRVELAAEEALVNVIHHAGAGDGEVEVSCETPDGATLIVRISDRGMPFDPLAAAEPQLGGNLAGRQVGGLGIALMRRMANGIEYRRDQDRNILTLTFAG